MAFGRTPSRRINRLLILLAAALLLITAVSVSAQDTGGTLRVGTNAPVELDPALDSNDPEIAFNRAIYDMLVDIKPDSSVAPSLAESWTISEDHLTYTFKLVQGVTFHDSSPLTSKDVVFSFNRLVSAESPAVGLLGAFEISAPDDSTVVFTLPEVNVDFLYGVGSRWSFILKDGQDNPNTLAEGSDNPFASFNGTGPFILTEYQPEVHAVLVRNDNYWQADQPKLAQLEFVYMADPVAQVDALLGGNVDFVFKLPNEQAARIEGQDGVTLLKRPTNQHAVIRLRTDQGPGVSVEVRQAFKYATDRDALNAALWEGYGTVGNNDPIGPQYGTYYNDQLQNQTYDPAKACELITQAGNANGLQMTLYGPNRPEYSNMATLLQQQWQATGCITVDLQLSEEGLYYDPTNPNNWLAADLGITGWGDRPAPQEYLETAYATGGPYNETHWSDADLDKLIAQAHSTIDVEERKAIYAQISEIFMERGPIIVPYFTPMIGGVRNTVEGLEMNPFPGLTDYRTVSVAG